MYSNNMEHSFGRKQYANVLAGGQYHLYLLWKDVN